MTVTTKRIGRSWVHFEARNFVIKGRAAEAIRREVEARKAAGLPDILGPKQETQEQDYANPRRHYNASYRRRR